MLTFLFLFLKQNKRRAAATTVYNAEKWQFNYPIQMQFFIIIASVSAIPAQSPVSAAVVVVPAGAAVAGQPLQVAALPNAAAQPHPAALPIPAAVPVAIPAGGVSAPVNAARVPAPAAPLPGAAAPIPGAGVASIDGASAPPPQPAPITVKTSNPWMPAIVLGSAVVGGGLVTAGAALGNEITKDGNDQGSNSVATGTALAIAGQQVSAQNQMLQQQQFNGNSGFGFAQQQSNGQNFQSNGQNFQPNGQFNRMQNARF